MRGFEVLTLFELLSDECIREEREKGQVEEVSQFTAESIGSGGGSLIGQRSFLKLMSATNTL